MTTQASSTPSSGAGEPTREGAVPRAFEVVLAHIESLVLDGSLKVGDRLPPERDLAVQLGVSRPAIREAIRTLEAQGVLASRVGSGERAGTHVISERSHALGRLLRLQVALAHFPIDEVVFTRIALERTSAELAVGRSDEELARLKELANAMDEVHDPDEFNDQDTRFHVMIADLGGNSMVTDLTAAVRESLRLPILAAERELADWPAFRDRLTREHHGIADALAAHDAPLAARLVEEHIRASYAIMPSHQPLPSLGGTPHQHGSRPSGNS